jgi:hypothetical protein
MDEHGLSILYGLAWTPSSLEMQTFSSAGAAEKEPSFLCRHVMFAVAMSARAAITCIMTIQR